MTTESLDKVIESRWGNRQRRVSPAVYPLVDILHKLEEIGRLQEALKVTKDAVTFDEAAQKIRALI